MRWMWLGLAAGCGTIDDHYTVVSYDPHGCGNLVVDSFQIERGGGAVRPEAQKGDPEVMTWDFALRIDSHHGLIVHDHDCEFVEGNTGAFFCESVAEDWELRAVVEGTLTDDRLELSYTSEWFSTSDEGWSEPSCAFEAEAEPTQHASPPSSLPLALGVTAT